MPKVVAKRVNDKKTADQYYTQLLNTVSTGNLDKLKEASDKKGVDFGQFLSNPKNLEKTYQALIKDYPTYKKSMSDGEVEKVMKTAIPGWKLPDSKTRKKRLEQKEKLSQKLYEINVKADLAFQATYNPKTMGENVQRWYFRFNDMDLSKEGLQKTKARYEALLGSDPEAKKAAYIDMFKEIGQMDFSKIDLRDPDNIIENIDMIAKASYIGFEMEQYIKEGQKLGIDFNDVEMAPFCLNAAYMYNIGGAIRNQIDRICSNGYEYFGLGADKGIGGASIYGEMPNNEADSIEEYFGKAFVNDITIEGCLSQAEMFYLSDPIYGKPELSAEDIYKERLVEVPSSDTIKAIQEPHRGRALSMGTIAETQKEEKLRAEAEQKKLEDDFLEEMGMTREDIRDLAEANGLSESKYLKRMMEENQKAMEAAGLGAPEEKQMEAEPKKDFKTLGDVERFLDSVPQPKVEDLPSMKAAFKALNQMSKDNPNDAFKCYQAGELLNQLAKGIGEIVKANPEYQEKPILDQEDIVMAKATMNRHFAAAKEMQAETTMTKEASQATFSAAAEQQITF